MSRQTLHDKGPRLKVKFVLPQHHEYEAIPNGDLDDAAMKIRSIVPLIVRKCNEFCRRLSSREMSQFDVVDVIQEIWIVLLEKHRYFKPERGIKYSTWALLVVNQQLGMIRNRVHIVDSPRDTASKLRNADKHPPEVIKQIQKAISETHSIDLSIFDFPDHSSPAEPTSEHAAYCAAAIREGLTYLDPKKAKLLSLKWGLCGKPAKTTAEIVKFLGNTMTTNVCERLITEAQIELADILQNRGLTYTSSMEPAVFALSS